MVLGNYRADCVDPAKTVAMNMFTAAYRYECFPAKLRYAFNVKGKGEGYLVQAGYTNNGRFHEVCESVEVRIPEGLTLAKVADSELLLVHDNVDIYIDGKLTNERRLCPD